MKRAGSHCCFNRALNYNGEKYVMNFLMCKYVSRNIDLRNQIVKEKVDGTFAHYRHFVFEFITARSSHTKRLLLQFFHLLTAIACFGKVVSSSGQISIVLPQTIPNSVYGCRAETSLKYKIMCTN
jgi:hypothetical protein